MSRVENEATGDADGVRMVAVSIATVMGRRPGVVLWHSVGPLQSRRDRVHAERDASADLMSEIDSYMPFSVEEFEHWVVLEEVGGSRVLPIAIGAAEANAMGMVLRGMPSARPLNYDLAHDVLERFRLRVRRVEIASLADEVYYASVVIASDRREEVFDGRPSDALNLAVRAGSPVFVRDDLLQDSDAARNPSLEVLAKRVELVDEQSGDRAALLRVVEPPKVGGRVRLMQRTARAPQVQASPARAAPRQTDLSISVASEWQVTSIEQLEPRLWRAVARRAT